MSTNNTPGEPLKLPISKRLSRDEAAWMQAFIGLSERQRALAPMLDDLAALRGMDDAAVKLLWDAYDGTNSPRGYSGEAIHLDLNLRGLGDYCAV